MLLDTRGLDYSDAFREVSNVVWGASAERKEITVLIDSHEKSQVIKGFAEMLLGCSATLEEARHCFFLKIMGNAEAVS